MNWLVPALMAVFILLYLRSPIDLIPDLIRPFGLLDDLALILWGLWWYKRRRAAAPRQPPREQAPGWDPRAVLGVSPGASHAEIAQAYRQQLKRYHPDRVADLGEELQRVAHEKTVELRRAYEELNGA